MTGTDAALFIALAAFLALAVVAGIVLAARSPAVWKALGAAVFSQLIPLIAAYVLKRNTPEIEARMQECYRRGGQWDNFNKRCK